MPCVPRCWRVGSIEPAWQQLAQINGGHTSRQRLVHRIRLIGKLCNSFFRVFADYFDSCSGSFYGLKLPKHGQIKANKA